MAKTKKFNKTSRRVPADVDTACREDMNCCKVESLTTIDERGQMVLPKELREKANIKAGDKFAITSWKKDGKICCLTLVKVDDLTDMIKEMLGPVMNELFEKK